MTWLRSARNTAFFQLPPAGCFTGITAGLVVGYTRLHPEWAPAQIPALALLAWSLAKTTGIVGRLRPGFWFGASMAALVLGHVGVPGPAAMILFVAMTAYWMLLGAGLSHPLQRGDIAGVFGAAGLLTLGEWAQSEALPLFGTAQRFTSAWVDYDAALPVSRVSGTLGVTLVAGIVALTFAKSFPVNKNSDSTHRVIFTTRPLIPALSIILTLAAIGTFSGINKREGYSRGITVAACGAASPGDGAFLDEAAFLKKYRPMLAAAAAKGAKLVVTPEMGLSFTGKERDAVLARMSEEARKLGVAWVLGYAQALPKLNRAVLLNADKPVGESYDKTYWVPNIETYAHHGDARAVTGTVAGAKVGLMICQDDNYETVAKNLSLAGVQVAAVPTFDWSGVEHAHLDSARNRPREFGFVSARAAIGGVSAIIDSTGNIVASRNHLTEGDGMTLATVSVDGGAPTVFARLGNAPLLALSALLLVNALRRRRPPVAGPAL